VRVAEADVAGGRVRFAFVGEGEGEGEGDAPLRPA
jgi:hypothetical protein